MEYEHFYYDLTGKEERWQEFPLKNLVLYLQRTLKPDSRVLDIGCGTGNVLKFLPRDIDYTGLDQSEFAVEKARKFWADHPHAKFLVYDRPELPYSEESFDVVLLLFSLEHLKLPQKILLECIKILKNGGIMIVLAPNLEFPFAWPNALRHKNLPYRILFIILRIGDYLKRIVGSYSFRVLSGNITSEKGIYERKDDDLWHMVSSWEVVKFLENKGIVLEEFWKEKKMTGWRKLLTFLPALHWYGMTLAAVFRKR